MNEKQPEALRLACECAHGYPSTHDAIKASIEMRRQHELIQEMREALAWYVEEDDVVEDMPGNEPWVAGKNRAIAALAKAEAQQ